MGAVEHATSCQLRLLSRQSFPVVYSHNPTTACGPPAVYSAFVTIGANPSPVKRTVAFALVAVNGPYSFTGRFYVSHRAPARAAGPVRPRRSGRTTAGRGPGPRGGDRQVGLLVPAPAPVAPVLPRRLLPQPDDGVPPRRFSAHVTIGANPSPVQRTVAFALVARNGPFSFTGRFYVCWSRPGSPPQSCRSTLLRARLGPSGGQVQVTGTVKHARSCQLRLLSAPVLPRRLLPQPDHGLPRWRLLGPRDHRRQPEPRNADGRLRPGRAQRAFGFPPGGSMFRWRPAQPSTTDRPAAPKAATDPYPAGATGYDVSWPQCRHQVFDQDQAVAGRPVVRHSRCQRRDDQRLQQLLCGRGGLGRHRTFPFTSSCSRPRAAHRRRTRRQALKRPVPPPAVSARATTGATTTPKSDIAFVQSRRPNPRIWWLDVETAEGWPTSPMFQPVNAAIVQGALAAIKEAGDVGGIYCTWYQWGQITGSYVPCGRPADMGGGRRQPERGLLQRAVVLHPGAVARRPVLARLGVHRFRRRRALARAVRLRRRLAHAHRLRLFLPVGWAPARLRPRAAAPFTPWPGVTARGTRAGRAPGQQGARVAGTGGPQHREALHRPQPPVVEEAGAGPLARWHRRRQHPLPARRWCRRPRPAPAARVATRPGTGAARPEARRVHPARVHGVAGHAGRGEARCPGVGQDDLGSAWPGRRRPPRCSRRPSFPGGRGRTAGCTCPPSSR